jgi:hypothetical protein
VLNLAASTGRHTRLLLESGFAVCVVDRDISELSALAGIGCEVRQVDLETGAPWVLGTGYDGIVVTNYLHRPLLPAITEAFAAGGVLIYNPADRSRRRPARTAAGAWSVWTTEFQRSKLPLFRMLPNS